MVNRERFMLDFDSEGFVEPPTNPYATLNIGKTPDVRLAQALLQDAGCLQCPPPELCSEPRCILYGTKKASSQSGCACSTNPQGWDEIDGVKLPPIIGWIDTSNIISDAQFAAFQNELREMHEAEVANARAIVVEADRHMDGVTRLSDTSAPDAYFGWKS